jgi:arylformamidase
MHIYDISLTVTPDLPVWPNDPRVVIERVAEIGHNSSANISRLEMSAHSGTHVDAPLHFIADGAPVDRIPLKILTGRVYLMHLPNVTTITAEALQKADIPPRTRRIIFRTRNSQYWSKSISGFQTDFVGISEDGARFLVNKGLKLVGIDYMSVAPFINGDPTHQIFLKAGIILLEGLDLSKVSQGRYMLYCLPLKLGGADGAPARAILVGV